MVSFVHNWTGCLAVHAAFASPALRLQPVKGVNTAKSAGSRGSWLKASSHARLRLHAGNDLQPCTLSLHIQDTVLLQRPLVDAQLRLAVLPCEQTSVLLLFPRQQDPGTAAPVTYCFAFFDQPDCASFMTAMQTMLDRQQQQQLAAQQAALPGQGQDLDQADAAAALRAQDTNRPGGEMLLQADAKEAVKRFLMDPEFQRLVNQVDAIWDEVEADVEALAALGRGQCAAVGGSNQGLV